MSIEKEVLACKKILRDNALAKIKLHQMAGRPGDSPRSEFASNPPTLAYLHKLKGKFLTPFLKARTCTRSDEQVVKAVGKPKDVQPIIDRLNADPGSTHTKKEDCLLLRAYLCRSSTDLTLEVPDESREVEEEKEDDAEAAAPVTMRSMFDEPELLAEVARCVVNLDADDVVVTEEEKTMRNDLVRKVLRHLDRFKTHTLESVPQLVNHWTIAAFEDNVQPIAELIVLLRLVSVNVGATKYGKSLLRSMSAACDLSVSDVSLLQGVMIVRDWQRGVYVNVVKASGTDSSGTNITFEKVHSDMVKASKKPADGKVFEESYPFKRPPSGIQGGVEGVYADLEMLVGIAIDTSQSTKCLTRLDKGMFY